MLKIKQQMDASDARAQARAVEPEEIASYDAVSATSARVYEEAFLRGLLHDVVLTIRRNLKVKVV